MAFFNGTKILGMGANITAGLSKEEAINLFADAIKATKSGTIVQANDVSSFEHELEVKAKRNPKNELPYPFEKHSLGFNNVKTKTVNGITFTDNGDGTVTVNGTATAQAQILLHLTIGPYTGHYTVSGCPAGAGEGCGILIGVKEADGVTPVGTWSQTNGSSFVKELNNNTLYYYIRIQSGTTVENLVFKPQIEKGNKVTAFVPYVDVSTVNVSVCEKNLLSINSISVPNGNTQTLFEGNEEGTFVFDFDNNTNGMNSSEPMFRIQGDWASDTVVPEYIDSSTPLPLTFSGVLKKVSFESATTATSGSLDNIILAKNPQTKLANADGTVEGLKSVSPDMVVFADKDGAFIDCTYKADTKKYIDNKFAELSAAILNS